jgi:hypothetical protein
MYEGILVGFIDQHKDFTATFTAAAVDLKQSGLAKKKSLRSGEGEITVTKNDSRKGCPSYRRGGVQFNAATLTDCATPGLMEAGVLKKPDAWTHHRMKRPAKPEQGTPRVPPKLILDTGAVEPKTVELFDLCVAGSVKNGRTGFYSSICCSQNCKRLLWRRVYISVDLYSHSDSNL